MVDIRTETWVMTGAAGRIGRWLAPQIEPLVGRLVRTDFAIPADSAPTGWRLLDIRDQDAADAALEGADGVLHLAGIPDEAVLHDLVDVNVVGTYHVLEAARRHGVRRIVLASTNHVTGFYPADQAVDVTLPVRPDSLYGASKVAAESLCRMYGEKFGLEAVAIRIGTFGATPTEARHLHTWLSPDDCTRAFVAAMSAPGVTYAAFYGVSDNRRRWWPLDDGVALGFVPEDDAEAFAAGMPDADAPYLDVQGGVFARAQYTLDRHGVG